jgi:hypothetical protein
MELNVVMGVEEDCCAVLLGDFGDAPGEPNLASPNWSSSLTLKPK